MRLSWASIVAVIAVILSVGLAAFEYSDSDNSQPLILALGLAGIAMGVLSHRE